MTQQSMLLSIEQVNKSYGKNQVLSDISFDIYKGEICGLVGQNGAGKTTLMRILSGLIGKDSGQIKQLQPYRMGSIIESPTLYPNMTAHDNLYYAALQLRLADAKERIHEVLELIGLEKVSKKKKVKDYSLGMRQRLAIGLSMLDFPEFLILDEPINGLDPAGIKEMRQIILNLRDCYGITILISSHILSELDLVVDRYVIMHKGKVIKSMDKAELKAQVKVQIALHTSDDQLVKNRLLELGLRVETDGQMLLIKPTLSVMELIKIVLDLPVEIFDIYHHQVSFEHYYLDLLGKDAASPLI